MSDTPRTDAALVHNAELHDEGHGYSPYVRAEFARQLESELAEMQRRLQATIEAADFLAKNAATTGL